MADQNLPVTGYPATNDHPPTNGTSNNAAYVSSNPYYSRPYANQQRATLLHRIFYIFIGCIIITGTVVFIMWLILRPQAPQFRIETLTLTNFTSSNSLVTGNWDARLTVRNSNSKMTLYYDQIEAGVFYKSESVSKTTVAPFVQGKKSETNIRATFASLSEYVDDLNGINSDRASGKVSFNLKMMARVKFKASSWWTRRRILRISCPNLSVAISGNSTAGSLTGGSKNCKVSF